MDIWLWIIILVIAVLIGFIMVGRRNARSRIDPTDVTITPALARQVKDLYLKDKKLEAVKALREETGLGLADAIRIADKLGGADKPKQAAGTAAGSSAIGPDHQDEIRSLVAAGQQIQAIKKVRELTGMGLQDAKNYVDGL